MRRYTAAGWPLAAAPGEAGSSPAGAGAWPGQPAEPNRKGAPVMGITATAAAATSSSGSSSTFLILIVVVFIGFYFLLIRPQRNRQKKVMEQQRTVQPGARVRTTAGMYATVVAVDGDDVVLEIAPDVEARFMKRAIMEVVGEGPGAPVDDEVDEDEDETAEPGEGETVDEADEPEDASVEDGDGAARPAESDPEITVYHSGNGQAGTTAGNAASKE